MAHCALVCGSAHTLYHLSPMSCIYPRLRHTLLVFLYRAHSSFTLADLLPSHLTSNCGAIGPHISSNKSTFICAAAGTRLLVLAGEDSLVKVVLCFTVKNVSCCPVLYMLSYTQLHRCCVHVTNLIVQVINIKLY